MQETRAAFEVRTVRAVNNATTAATMRPASSAPAGRAAAGYAALRQPRGGDKHWSQMGGAEQAAVMALGWTAASWDAGDEGPLQVAWEELGAAQTWAAGALGYKRTEFGRASLDAALDLRLSSSVEVGKRTTSLRSPSTDAAQEVLARDSDAVASVFYPEQR